MKAMQSLLVVAVAAVIAVGLAAGCKEKSGPAGGAAAPIAQKLCPVTGQPIDPNVYVDYEGRRIYFCCNACPAEFKKDPAKYLAILDQQMKGAMPAPSPAMPAMPAMPGPAK